MISSCERNQLKIEKVKFDDLLAKVYDNRQQVFMKNLEDMQNRNAGLPGINSRGKFVDAQTKIDQFTKNNMYNVSNLFSDKSVFKIKPKKMTQNQYSNLLKHLESKKKENLRQAVKNRYQTTERPGFGYFDAVVKNKLNAWEDFSYNPKTTKLLATKIKKDLAGGYYKNLDDNMKIDSFEACEKMMKGFISVSVPDTPRQQTYIDIKNLKKEKSKVDVYSNIQNDKIK